MEPVDGAKYGHGGNPFGGSVGNGRYLVLGFEGRKNIAILGAESQTKTEDKD